MEVEIEETVIDYDKFVNELGKNLVNRTLPHVREEVQKVLSSHRITGETEESITVRPVGQTKQTGYGVRGEVYTKVPWAPILEYLHVPFMRLGARKARKHARRLVKEIFGETMRGMTRVRKRRRVK